MGVTKLIHGTHNIDISLLASAARTATTTGDDETNLFNTGLVLFVDVTARAASTTLTPELHIKDPVGGDYVTIWTAAAAINSANTTVAYLFYPGVIATGNVTYTEEMDAAIPRTWRVKITHSDANSVTYSVSASYIV